MKRFILLLLALNTSTLLFAQLNAGEDQTICIGETTQLEASGGSNYTWTSIPNDPTISNPNIANPIVQPTTTTTYIVKSREVGNNVINNSGFEQGNTGFSSDYIYNPVTIVAEGTYAIVADANTVHPNFFCNEDHTTGDGLMMCVNGSGVPGVEVWTTSIPFISQNTEFEFSTWISSLVSGSPAILQFSINGVLLGQPFQAVSATCQWNQFFEIWDSGSSSTATISIINQNTATSGNDFALDDISFAIVTYHYDTVVVHVVDRPTSDFVLAAELCTNDTAKVVYNGNASDTADYYWDFDDGNILNGSGQGPYSVFWDTPGPKQISLWVEMGCASDTTLQTIMVNQSPEAEVQADATLIPYGTNTILHGGMTGFPGPLVFSWDPEIELLNPFNLDPTTQLLYSNTQFIFTVTDESSQCKATDTILIEVSGGPLLITSLAAVPDRLCLGESAVLELQVGGGSGSYTAEWISDPPGFIYNGPEMVIPVTPTTSTTYYVTVNDGFTTTPQDSVVVTVLPQIAISSNPTDTVVAPQQTIFFEVETQNGFMFQWQLSENGGITWSDLSDDATYDGSQTTKLTIDPTTPEMDGWQFRCMVTGECDPSMSGTAQLSIVEAPMMLSTLDDSEACEGDTITVAYRVSNFIGLVDLQLVLEFESQQLAFLELTNISSELIQNILVKSEGNQVTINWISTDPVSLSNENAFSLIFVSLAPGSSQISWKTEDCYATNSFNYNTSMDFSGAEVILNPLPVTPDEIVSDRDTLSILEEVDISLFAEGGSGDYLHWSFANCGELSIGSDNPLVIYRPENTTTYFAQWENGCGLSSCKEITIVILHQYGIYAPNAFSPNGDGLNDQFSLVSSNDLYSFRLIIFNRWGQQVFESTDLYQGWDGKFTGQDVEMGTYVWQATYQFRGEGRDSEYRVENGIVTLVR